MSTVSEIQTARVAGAFDSVAPVFESSLENEVTRSLRKKVYDTIESLVRPGSSILDINCGIGIDAVELARKGYRVVGTDLSAKMVDEARSRAAKQGVTVEFQQSSFENLSSVAGEQYDLVLSNFGGLNCVESLETVATQVASVTKPSGHFVAVFMPKVSLWEIVAGLTRLNPGFAFRRFREETLATGFPGKPFRVFYYSPRKIGRPFEAWFTVKSIQGLNVLSPPPHATVFRNNHPASSLFLERIDQTIGTIPFLRSAGDHSLIVLKKQSS